MQEYYAKSALCGAPHNQHLDSMIFLVMGYSINSFTVVVVIVIIVAVVGGAGRILEVSEGTVVRCVISLPYHCDEVVHLCVNFTCLF